MSIDSIDHRDAIPRLSHISTIPQQLGVDLCPNRSYRVASYCKASYLKSMLTAIEMSSGVGGVYFKSVLSFKVQVVGLNRSTFLCLNLQISPQDLPEVYSIDISECI